MLWASDAKGPDGKPAVLLLAASRTSRALTAEVAYVATAFTEGALSGRYYRREGDEGEAVTVAWPGGWPTVKPTNKLHPNRATPQAALTTVDGETRIRLEIRIGALSDEQES